MRTQLMSQLEAARQKCLETEARLKEIRADLVDAFNGNLLPAERTARVQRLKAEAEAALMASNATHAEAQALLTAIQQHDAGKPITIALA